MVELVLLALVLHPLALLLLLRQVALVFVPRVHLVLLRGLGAFASRVPIVLLRALVLRIRDPLLRLVESGWVQWFATTAIGLVTCGVTVPHVLPVGVLRLRTGRRQSVCAQLGWLSLSRTEPELLLHVHSSPTSVHGAEVALVALVVLVLLLGVLPLLGGDVIHRSPVPLRPGEQLLLLLLRLLLPRSSRDPAMFFASRARAERHGCWIVGHRII